MKIATWNVNSLKVRLPHVLEWAQMATPDVIALQETKLTDENFPETDITDAGFHVVYAGQKTYNGVAILSRYELTDVVTDIPDLADPQRRILAATTNGVRIIDLYVPNGASLDSDKYPYKLNWLAKVTAFIQQQLQEYPELVVLGDFNIAPADDDVHDPTEWEGHVLVSPPEREALQGIMDLGLSDSFRLFEQPEKSFSWWDYRAAGFRRNRGLRIDHILVSEALKARCKACIIDKEPRKWERPSDHAPVLADFASKT
ncbi:MAG: exodeoxyribonuclease III [Legionellales bacterium]|mgnify:CR=1 FL=1|nr:exodeoxyribonuclease III [Legionellales bacterium]|tara:strand:- start:1777 stop:2550 length:774 start_codon:yes stop_codon:yes gene_type:complete